MKEADAVFSISHVLQSEVAYYIKYMEHEDRPVHKMYIPTYPLELFHLHHETVKGNQVEATQNISMMTGENNDLRHQWT